MPSVPLNLRPGAREVRSGHGFRFSVSRARADPRVSFARRDPISEFPKCARRSRTGVGTRAHGDVVVAGERDDERRRKGARAGRSGRGLPSRPVRERRAHFGNSEIGSFFRGSAVPARQNESRAHSPLARPGARVQRHRWHPRSIPRACWSSRGAGSTVRPAHDDAVTARQSPRPPRHQTPKSTSTSSPTTSASWGSGTHRRTPS